MIAPRPSRNTAATAVTITGPPCPECGHDVHGHTHSASDAAPYGVHGCACGCELAEDAYHALQDAHSDANVTAHAAQAVADAHDAALAAALARDNASFAAIERGDAAEAHRHSLEDLEAQMIEHRRAVVLAQQRAAEADVHAQQLGAMLEDKKARAEAAAAALADHQAALRVHDGLAIDAAVAADRHRAAAADAVATAQLVAAAQGRRAAEAEAEAHKRKRGATAQPGEKQREAMQARVKAAEKK